MSIFATSAVAASTSVEVVASVASATVSPTSFADMSSSYDTSSSLVIGIYFVLATLLFAALGLLVTRGLVSHSSPPPSDAPPEYEQVPSCEVDVERTAELDKENGEIVFVTKKTERMNIRQYLAEQRLMQSLSDAGFIY